MKTGRHSLVTTTQREELWRRYRAGESIKGIGCALGQRRNKLYRVLEATGGIAPPRRRRSPRVLKRFPAESPRMTFRAIARRLNRAVSSVSQEVARHIPETSVDDPLRPSKLCARKHNIISYLCGLLRRQCHPDTRTKSPRV
jgi:hypothetical protein